jgi:phage terminase large subunit
MPRKIRIPDMQPRSYQLPFFRAMDSGIKKAVLVWHRRAGKEIVCWNYMIREACCGRVGTYCYFFPSSRLGKRILWDGANKDGRRFVDYIPKELIKSENSVEMKIELKNGSVIQIIGTDQILNVGINPIGCVFSEFSLQDPKTWAFVRPILKENEGWAVFNFTPRGKNHAFDLYQMAKDNENWFCQKLGIDSTDVLTHEDMEDERKEGMSENLIQQEYYCNFNQGIEGSVYSKYLTKMELDERVCNIPYDPYALVDTYWDIGVSDATTIIVSQNVGQEVRIIDSYTAEGEGLDHYVRWIENKAKDNLWKYGRHCAPHDIQVREWAGGAKTRLQTAKEMGLEFEIVPNLSIQEGISMTRAMFHKLWIDKKSCAFLLKCIENYHYVYNERLNIFSDKPCHDWSSHFMDALRYMGVMQNKSRIGKMTEEQANDLESRYATRY